MFTPLNVKSHYSLLHSISKVDDIVNRCVELGYKSCALTDLGSISGIVEFAQKCKEKEIKPIFGCIFYITEQDPSIKQKGNPTHQITVLAKNLAGWKDLVKAVCESNTEECFYENPRLNLDRLVKYTDNWVLLSSDPYFFDKPAIRDTDFFIELHPQKDNIKLREFGIKCVATPDSYYMKKTDAIDHRVLLCSLMKTTLKKYGEVLYPDNHKLAKFFTSDNFYLASKEEMKPLFSEEEINNSNVIADMCESYSILGKPKLPKFNLPSRFLSQQGYLEHLCEEGFKCKVEPHLDEPSQAKSLYVNRVNHELDVIKEAGLAGYFLVVQDYVNWAKNQGWLVGPGRGSAGGSLVAYLLNITTIDPIQYGLIFERFYNAGRNTKDYVSLPDIDVDFPVAKREQVIQYIRDKYGSDRVAHIATFGRLQGRAALKEVLRVHEVCDAATMHRITKDIPQEGKISDKLEESSESSIIRWTLVNEPGILKDYCTYDGTTYSGEYAVYVEQAVRLEGTFKSQGKHASGIVITADPLIETCPMLYSENGEAISGWEMDSMEAAGLNKADILGLATLDKLMLANELLQFGRFV